MANGFLGTGPLMDQYRFLAGLWVKVEQTDRAIIYTVRQPESNDDKKFLWHWLKETRRLLTQAGYTDDFDNFGGHRTIWTKPLTILGVRS